jgi:hypothetical protein
MSFGPSPRVLFGAVCRQGPTISRGVALSLATFRPWFVREGPPLRAVEETDTVDRRGGRVLLESLFLPRTPEPFEMHTVFLSFAGAGSAGPSSDDSARPPIRTPPIV